MGTYTRIDGRHELIEVAGTGIKANAHRAVHRGNGRDPIAVVPRASEVNQSFSGGEDRTFRDQLALPLTHGADSMKSGAGCAATEAQVAAIPAVSFGSFARCSDP